MRGIQAVDGLKISEYLVHTAVRNIEGEISFEEANALLRTYYEENPTRDASDRTEEADKVSARIAALLSERAFSFTPNEYLSIHRKLFTGIYSMLGVSVITHHEKGMGTEWIDCALRQCHRAVCDAGL